MRSWLASSDEGLLCTRKTFFRILEPFNLSSRKVIKTVGLLLDKQKVIYFLFVPKQNTRKIALIAK